MQPIPSITGQTVKVTATLAGPDLTLVCVVHAAASVPYAEVYAVSRAGASRVIGRSEALGKDDSGSAVAFPDGTVRLYVSEADPGQSGSTAHVTYYDFPGAVPAQQSGANFDARPLIKQIVNAVVSALAPFR